MHCEIDIIGGVDARVNGEQVHLRRQVQRLAAVLVAAGPSGIEASALAEELWVGHPPVNWNAALRNALTSARATLGTTVISTAGGRHALCLPPEAVDAWRILDASASPGSTIEVLRGTGRFLPFDGLEPSPMLQEMGDALRNARLGLIDTIESRCGVDPMVMANLLAAVRADPFDDGLATAVAEALTRLGRPTEALTLINEVECALADELGAVLPPSLDALRRRVARSREAETRASGVRPLPAVVDGLTRRPMAGRHRSLARSLGEEIMAGRLPPRLALIEPAGSGKSRFAAEMSRQAHELGADVTFTAALPEMDSAYGPFLAGVPEFRRRFIELGATNESAVWSLWASVLDHAEPDRAMVLVVDDAHWLDRASIRLLQFIHRMQSAAPLTTVVVGRPSTGRAEWTELQTELVVDDRTETIAVPPLDVADVAELIGRRWPDTTDVVQHDAANEITAASAGLPLVANVLIDSLEGPSLRRPPLRGTKHVDLVSDRLSQLDPAAQNELAAASVLGTIFDTDQVADLVDTDVGQVELRLEQLVRQKLLAPVEPGRYRFDHDLIRQAASTLVSRRTQATWHGRLVASTKDPIRRARHAMAANPTIDHVVAAELGLDGARSALDRGLSRMAAELAQGVVALAANHAAEQQATACLAVAQARLGAFDDCISTRTKLVRMADSPEAVELATRTLLECLPLVEYDDSTALRSDEFSPLPVDGLPPSLRFDRAVGVARLASMEGDHELQERALAECRAFEQDNSDRARVFMAEWFANTTTAGPGWFDDLDVARSRAGDPFVIAKLTQVEALERSARADWAAAEEANDRALEITAEHSIPDVHWQSLLLSGALSFALGDLDRSTECADRAFGYGRLFALPQAAAARAAQAFGVALVTGQVQEWLNRVRSGSGDITRASLAIAAVARATYEIGDVDEAWRRAGPVLRRSLETRNRNATSIIAVLAPLIRDRAEEEDRAAALEVIRAHEGRWIITAAGVGVHGPSRRTSAILRGDRNELLVLRDEFGDNELWQRVIDHDLASLRSED